MKKNDVSSFSQSPLIGSLSNLQVMSTGIKAQKSSNLGRIGLFTLELFALEHRFLIFNPRGYIHVLNHEHNCIKSDFKEISLKFATSDKAFLLTSKFCPLLELYSCIKS